MKILLVYGGTSPERDVSIRSAESVRKAIVELGYQVFDYDPRDDFENIRERVAGMDLVFPVLHGQQGEDGQLQEKLEELDIPYIGANSKVSRLCFNKQDFKKAIQSVGINIPAGEIVNWLQFRDSSLTKGPFVVKPLDGGSSIDTIISRDGNYNSKELAEIFNRNQTMLIEELIDGIEITVPVLLDEALPVIEIIPPQGQDFNYENKYNGLTQEICPPKNVASKKQYEAQQIAHAIHQRLNVQHLSRTDMIIRKDGKIFVLELNTLPGMTDASLLPKSAMAAGYSMEDIVRRLISTALNQV